MREFLEAINADFKRVRSEGRLIPPRVPPPDPAGARDLGEISDDHKALYSLLEIYLKRVDELKGKLPDGHELLLRRGNTPEAEAADWNLLAELELKCYLLRGISMLRLRQRYGRSQTVSIYKDWHVWEVEIKY